MPQHPLTRARESDAYRAAQEWWRTVLGDRVVKKPDAVMWDSTTPERKCFEAAKWAFTVWCIDAETKDAADWKYPYAGWDERHRIEPWKRQPTWPAEWAIREAIRLASDIVDPAPASLAVNTAHLKPEYGRAPRLVWMDEEGRLREVDEIQRAKRIDELPEGFAFKVEASTDRSIWDSGLQAERVWVLPTNRQARIGGGVLGGGVYLTPEGEKPAPDVLR